MGCSLQTRDQAGRRLWLRCDRMQPGLDRRDLDRHFHSLYPPPIRLPSLSVSGLSWALILVPQNGLCFHKAGFNSTRSSTSSRRRNSRRPVLARVAFKRATCLRYCTIPPPSGHNIPGTYHHFPNAARVKQQHPTGSGRVNTSRSFVQSQLGRRSETPAPVPSSRRGTFPVPQE